MHFPTLLSLLLLALPLMAVPSAASMHSHSRRATCTATTQLGLNANFQKKDNRYFGTTSDYSDLTKDIIAKLIKAEFGFITPENSMKWDTIQPSKGNFDFQKAEQVVDFAQTNGLKVRGHTLIWHSQLPTWVKNINNAQELESVMVAHITKVVSQFKGQVYSWDVVNEPFDESGNLRTDNVFYRLLGEKYISIAFKAAYDADKDVKLYINEYNIDDPKYKKTQGFITKVKQWIKEGVPIHGVGSQTHLRAQTYPTAQYVPEALKAVCAIAKECAVTELDLEGANASDYTKPVQACKSIDNCVGVTVWGVSDAVSWRRSMKPLLFDENYNKKPAYCAVLEAM
ncbi:hypothetical protein ACQY0O_004635 [Thecaphora frezii]